MDYSGKIITKNAVEPSQTSAPGVWTLDQAAQAVESNTWPIANVPNPISRSLRFNSADSTYLNRTPTSNGNRQIWTYSGWVKKTCTTVTNKDVMVFGGGAGNSTVMTQIRFHDGNGGWTFWMGSYNGSSYDFQTETSALFRDPSAWYHLVVSVDTTQATSANRVKFYVNGVLQSRTSSDPTQNYNTYVNSTSYKNYIGAYAYNESPETNGYMTQVQFIDGQALTPSSFGMTDPRTGAWISKPYTGTYGTNGFYLNFSDNSTTAALGTDYSGNNNTWTTNNFSVTAGSGNDSMVDVPTLWIPYNTTGDVGGVVRGNYATWSAIDKGSVTVTNGNLEAVSAADLGAVRGTIGLPQSGKWYWEVTVSGLGYGSGLGIADNACPVSNFNAGATQSRTFQWGSWFNSFNSGVVQYGTNQSITGGSNWSSASQLAANDIVIIAVDMDNGSMWVGKNGSWFNSSGTANPATNTDPRWTGLTGTTWFPVYTSYGSTSPPTATANFGQRPFAYTPPAGFKSLCTTNLPEPTVLDGGDYFNPVLYTGNNQTLQSITTVGFQPDLIWIKNRNASNHVLVDAVRGRGFHLASNLTNAEATDSSTQGVTAFLSNGFSVEADPASYGSVNDGTNPYVAWNWKANGVGSSISAGSIDGTNPTIASVTSANTTSGVSIITYSGNGTAGATIAHGLGVAPSMIIVKRRNGGSGYSWHVQHVSLGNTKAIFLDSLNGAATNSVYWNNTSPNSTVFTAGSDTSINGSGGTFVAYCFAAVPGFSAFGSYAGSDTTKVFVYTGFRPAFVLLKKSSEASTTYGWPVLDKVRPSPSGATEGYNPTLELWADSSTGELSSSSNYKIDLLSNGFCINEYANTNVNASGKTYIYAAFASNPFKYSNAR